MWEYRLAMGYYCPVLVAVVTNGGLAIVLYPIAETMVVDVGLAYNKYEGILPLPPVATQEQTARAADETWRPVTAPQLLTMQSKAAL